MKKISHIIAALTLAIILLAGDIYSLSASELPASGTAGIETVSIENDTETKPAESEPGSSSDEYGVIETAEQDDALFEDAAEYAEETDPSLDNDGTYPAEEDQEAEDSLAPDDDEADTETDKNTEDNAEQNPGTEEESVSDEEEQPFETEAEDGDGNAEPAEETEGEDFEVYPEKTDEDGEQEKAGADDEESPELEPKFFWADKYDGISGSMQKVFRLTVSNLDKAKVSEVKAAVWPDSNPSAKIYYTATSRGSGTYAADVKVKDFKTAGLYNAEIYVTDKEGNTEMLFREKVFTADDTVSGNIKKKSQNQKKGVFRISYNPSAPSGVKSVRFYVWTKTGMKDKCKYEGQLKSDGTFTAVIDNANHSYKSGTFRVKASVTMGNGITTCSDVADFRFIPRNQIFIEKTEFGKRKIGIVNPDGDDIKIKVWSEANGNDDVKTYKAKQNGNIWKSYICLYKHVDCGTCQVRVYSGSTLLGVRSFVSEEGENKKNGWYRENNLKLYYKDGVMQTDLRGMVTGPYQIKTNIEKNVVTVYAEDGSNGFVIPVVNFICSAGSTEKYKDGKANETGSHCSTPAGTYTLIGKSRWHEFKAWDDWVQYAVKWKDTGVYFHSLAYEKKGDYYSLIESKYRDLGSNASHGCIRMLVEDIKWIYDNFDDIAECVFFEGEDIGPYPKPKKPAIGKTVIDGVIYYYDPTDPNVN